jgi:hypothetical protein
MTRFKRLKFSLLLLTFAYAFSSSAFSSRVYKNHDFSYTKLNFCGYLLAFSVKSTKPNSFPSDQQAEDGVREFLGEERYDYMSQINPGLISDLILRFRFGVELREWNSNREAPFKILESVILIYKEGNQNLPAPEFVQNYEQGFINPLRIDLPIDRSQQNFFILKNTGKVLVMNSWEVMKRLNQQVNN